MEKIGENRCWGGRQLRYRHASTSLGCTMQFSVFLPPQAESAPVPVLYWLSGLTCTDENFVVKAGAQRAAAAHGIAIVAMDTSPRGAEVPGDPDGGWDFGLGAGFYVNATEAPWDRHYRMYDYVVDELPALLAGALPLDTQRAGIAGHSMGGHGALTLGLRNPARYRAISAFAPICSPMRCPWGEKALSRFLGADRERWRAHDATELLRTATRRLPIRVDQGEADGFLQEQLKPELLAEAAAAAGYPIELHRHAGYDHSYFFIATFIDDHIAFHAAHLHAGGAGAA